MRLLFLLLIAIVLSACDRAEQTASGQHGVSVSVWAHAGQASERKTIAHQLTQFDQLHPDIHIKLTFIPERAYNAQVQAAAIAGGLPDLLEFDVPF